MTLFQSQKTMTVNVLLSYTCLNKGKIIRIPGVFFPGSSFLQHLIVEEAVTWSPVVSAGKYDHSDQTWSLQSHKKKLNCLEFAEDT